MPPHEYGFDDRLKMSQGVSDSSDVKGILLGNIPGAVSVSRAHLTNDRSGVDYWVEMCYGAFLAVDVKARGEDWAAKLPPQDDLALETYSVVESDVPGWTRNADKRTDYILWVWSDTGRWCLVPFRLLCQVFQENWQTWRSKYKTAQQRTNGWHNGGDYHSECVYVPRKIVWTEIYRRYSGLTQKDNSSTLAVRGQPERGGGHGYSGDVATTQGQSVRQKPGHRRQEPV